MTTVVPAMARSLRGYWRDARPAQRVAYVVGAALIVVGLAHGVAWLIVGGSLDGPVSFRKPITFGVSFGLATITLAWVSQFLALSDRALRATLIPLSVADTTEVLWVSVQRARGVASHFNQTTTFDYLFFLANGVAILVTIAVMIIYLVRSVTSSTAAPSMTLAIRVGLLILLVSMAAGVWMTVRGTGLDPLPEPTLVGGSGNIKIAHAVGMHGIQTLCALAWAASFTMLSEARRVRVVGLAAVGYAVATIGTMVLTALGFAPFAAGVASAVLAVVALGCLAGAAGVVLVALVRRPALPIRSGPVRS